MGAPHLPVAKEPDSPHHSTNWKRRGAIFAIAVVICGLGHAYILTAIASVLIVDEEHAAAYALLILDGDRRVEVASQRVSDGAENVLLFRRHPGRLERMGILPAPDNLTRRELLKRRIPEQAIRLLCEEPIDNSLIPNQLCDWLQKNPGRDIDVLCDRFSSRNCNRFFGRSVDSKFRQRLHIIALPQRNYDETNWWRSKQGALAVLNGYLSLAFQSCHVQGNRPVWKERTQAEFDSAVKARLRP